MSESASARRTETIPEWKREEVDELVAFLEGYDSVGIVRVAGIPSRQLQTMRRDLHGSAELRMSRNTLMRRALEAAGIDGLAEHVAGQVAFVGTDDNPFGLFRQLEASKTPAPINAGEVAPNDVVIPEGDTGVDPGPFVGELQTVGAQARIMDGSIHVTADSLVCEAGESVSADLANVLSELGIEPKEVGLDLQAVASEGVLFEPEELDIDVDAYRADVEAAAGRATGLSVGAAYPTARTAGTLLARGAGDARAVGLSAAVAEPGLAPDLLARADARLRALAARIDDEEALPEALRNVEVGAEPADAEDAADDGDDGDDADEADGADDQDQTDESDADDDDGGEGLGMMFG